MAISDLLSALSAAHRREIASEMEEIRTLAAQGEIQVLPESSSTGLKSLSTKVTAVGLLERDLAEQLHDALYQRVCRMYTLPPQNRLHHLNPRSMEDAIKQLYVRGDRLVTVHFGQHPAAIEFLEREGFFNALPCLETEATEALHIYLRQAAELPPEDRRLLGSEIEPLASQKTKTVNGFLKLRNRQNKVGLIAESVLREPVEKQSRFFMERLGFALTTLSFCLIIGPSLYQLRQGEKPSKVVDHLSQGAMLSCLPPAVGLAIGGIEWMLS